MELLIYKVDTRGQMFMIHILILNFYIKQVLAYYIFIKKCAYLLPLVQYTVITQKLDVFSRGYGWVPDCFIYITQECHNLSRPIIVCVITLRRSFSIRF